MPAIRPTMRQEGLTLIELMIAIAISMIVLVALTAMFVTSSRARDEITRANQQVESGRYALQVLSDDLRLAGYYGGHILISEPTPDPAPNTMLDACYTAMPGVSPDDDLEGALVIHVQGYDEAVLASPHSTCGGVLTDRKPNTDVLVIRRVSSCVANDADPTCPDDSGQLYFQASRCIDEMDSPTKYKYRLSTNSFDRTRRDCATPAEKRRFMTHIYYIDEVDHDGDDANDDGIRDDGGGPATPKLPRLMRAEMRDGNFNIKTPIAEGIEEMEFRYGIDYSGNDGNPDAYVANPNTYMALSGPGSGCPGVAKGCVENWRNVMTVEVNLLARSTDPSPGHTDTKTYDLCSDKPCTPNVDRFTPGGSFKRHVFQTTVRLNNPAGQRQQGG